MRDLLKVEGLSVTYGGVAAVAGLDLTVGEGTTVALIGANGAGKTSTLRALGGQVRSQGRVTLDGEDITGWRAHAIARRGFAQVPQGRRLFPELTVVENLSLGAYGKPAEVRERRIEEVCELFPRLRERTAQTAGSLSGGEQQMVAIGRALASDPVLVAMDEPSLGLAPILVAEVFETIQRIRERGTAILLVEQNAAKALESSDSVVVLDRGSPVFSGPSAQAREELDLIRTYLAVKAPREGSAGLSSSTSRPASEGGSHP